MLAGYTGKPWRDRSGHGVCDEFGDALLGRNVAGAHWVIAHNAVRDQLHAYAKTAHCAGRGDWELSRLFEDLHLPTDARQRLKTVVPDLRVWLPSPQGSPEAQEGPRVRVPGRARQVERKA